MFSRVILMAVLASALFGQKSIPLSVLRDKIAGGWAGQMIGVSYGAPTEFHYLERIAPADQIPKWTPGRVSNALDQDDLYVDMTFAQVLDDKGLEATTADFGNMFRNARYRLWHANLAARRALKRGVPAELSGTPKYNVHANDIDFQIESDFVGLMAPGLPASASKIAWRAGRVMNYGDGIYGGIFVTCMYSAAFFESDPHKVVRAGLACLPAQSPYAKLITDVLAWHDRSPNDWEGVWKQIEAKWNKREPCPEGALKPFNIDAKLNGAYIALGLLYGDGSMTKTIDVATRSGQDSDCNPASAAGILGVILGYQQIPDEWKSGIPPLADSKFSYTNFTFNTIVFSTYNRALALIQKTGGHVDATSATVKVEAPRPAPYEVWDDYGSPVERVDYTDKRWKFAGSWYDERGYLMSLERSASAEISFNGTGFIVVGPYLTEGGLVDLYLDGQPQGTVDVYPDEDEDRGGESVWHRFGLKPGEHKVQLIVRGKHYPGSWGSQVGISSLVVFR